MKYANTSNTQIVGIKNHTRETWRDVQTQTSPITWALNITPVIRGEVRKLKQAPPKKARVLKITPLLRRGYTTINKPPNRGY